MRTNSCMGNFQPFTKRFQALFYIFFQLLNTGRKFAYW